MKTDGRLTLTLVRELLRRGSIQRVKRQLEDRLMGVILDATRVTNDGSYRRYRDDPNARGELVRTPPGGPADVSGSSPITAAAPAADASPGSGSPGGAAAAVPNGPSTGTATASGEASGKAPSAREGEAAAGWSPDRTGKRTDG